MSERQKEILINKKLNVMETTIKSNETISEKVNVVENTKSEKKNKQKNSVKVEKQKNSITTKNNKIVSENLSKQASKLNFSSMLQNLDKSVLVTNSGQRKENLYKKEIYSECITTDDKKAIRRKIRNLLESFIESAIRCNNDNNKIKAIKKQFDLFYINTYRLNDYSLLSLVSNNTDQMKKDNVQKMLDLFKKVK